MLVVQLWEPVEDEVPPWPLADLPTGAYVALNGEVSMEVVGRVVYEWARQNGVHTHGDPYRILEELADTDIDEMTLAGGVSITATDGTVLYPAEGCGLEDWRDWLTYQSDEFDVWMGEHPAPYVERRDDGTLRVWEVWQKTPSEDVIYIDIPPEQVKSALKQLDADLRAFRRRLREWASALVDEELAAQLVQTFDEAF